MIYFISNQTRLFELDGIVSATLDDLSHWYESKLIDSEYHGGEFLIELDTETTGFNPQLRDKLKCIQLGDEHNQWVIDVTHLKPHTLPKEVVAILEDENVTFLLANAKFDLRFLFACGVYIKHVYDVFLAECLLTSGLRESKEEIAKYGLGLDDMALKYCGATLDKSIRGNIHKEGLTDRVIKYAADDVKYLSKIREKQLIEIDKWGMREVLNLENNAVHVFARMEYDGVHLDEQKWLAVSAITEANVKRLELELDDIVRKDPNLSHYVPKYIQSNLFSLPGPVRPNVSWSSALQKLKLLNDALRGGATGMVSGLLQATSVDEKTLQKLKAQHELVPKLLEHAKQAKLVSSFGQEFIGFQDKSTKRIYPNYWQILSTGRVSASKPNVNQIPSKGELAKAIRAAFTAPPGRKIVGGDYSGMELRIIAEFSKDPLWVTSFQKGLDLHTVLCAQTFRLDPSLVKEPFPPRPDWSYRDIQKTVGFGLAYGMTEYKLSNTAQIPIPVAKEIIGDFFAGCPDVERFLTGLGRKGVARNYIKSAKPYGRVRFFNPEPSQKLINSCYGSYERAFGVRRGEIERASKNHPIQSTNGDIIKLALINVQNFINEHKLDIKIILAVYDEIQTECEESIASWWAKELERLMIEAAETVIKTVPIKVECSVNDHWTK